MVEDMLPQHSHGEIARSHRYSCSGAKHQTGFCPPVRAQPRLFFVPGCNPGAIKDADAAIGLFFYCNTANNIIYFHIAVMI